MKINVKVKSTIIILTIQSEQKKIETYKNILIDAKNYKDLRIYFASYVRKKLIKMLRLHYHELMKKTEIQEGKKMFDG